MNCTEWEERIALYIAADLNGVEAAEVEAHVRTCAVCSELKQELERDAINLSTSPPEVQTVNYSDLRKNIRGRIAAEQRRKKLLAVLAVAAALVLVLILKSSRHQALVLTSPRFSSLEGTAGFSRPSDLLKAAVPRHSPARPDGRPRRPPPDPKLEALLQQFSESQNPPTPSGATSPLEMRIRTKDPSVTILVLQPTEGTPNENE